MSVELYLAFIAASIVLLLIPGPTISLVLGTAMARGTMAAMVMVPGVVLGDAVAATLSLAGVGALLLASATLFAIVKIVGAAYLIWLGIKMLRDANALTTLAPQPGAPARDARRAFLVTLLNPKSILFFVAFLPQFVDPGQPAAPQLLLLGATFVVLGGLNATAYAWAAGRAARLLREGARRWLTRFGGGCLIGAGALALTQGNRA